MAQRRRTTPSRSQAALGWCGEAPGRYQAAVGWRRCRLIDRPPRWCRVELDGGSKGPTGVLRDDDRDRGRGQTLAASADRSDGSPSPSNPGEVACGLGIRRTRHWSRQLGRRLAPDVVLGSESRVVGVDQSVPRRAEPSSARRAGPRKPTLVGGRSRSWFAVDVAWLSKEQRSGWACRWCDVACR